MERPDRDSVLAHRAADLLADGVPRTMAAIAAALGLPPPADEYEQEDMELVLGLDDDRYAYRGEAEEYLDLRALLAGRTFTCDPGSLQGDPARVSVDPDLGLLLLPVLRAERIPVSGGHEAHWEDDAPFGVVWMPAEPVLEAVSRGTPGFTWEDQALAVRAVAVDRAESQRVAAAIRGAFERQDAECADLVDLLIEVLLDDEAAFRTPVAPVGSLLARAELSRRGDYVGRVGVPWKTPLERVEDDRDALNTSAYGFDECCHRAFHTLTRGFLEFRAGREPEPKPLAEAADHGVVAEAFLAAEITGPLADGLAESLSRFADALVPRGGPGAQFLRFAVHDLLDEAAEAERCLGRALEADPDFAPALAELATIAEERGRAAEAVEHLRRLGAPPDDPQLRRVQDALRWGRSATGRNAPCPCGSGRKYKVCCLGRELPPLAERVDWLFAKAVAFANRPAERGLLLELAEALTRGPGEGELLDALSEPLVTDVALFEEGLLERYLAVRGALLPEDERALAAAWLQRPRSLLEITGVAPGELELRDTLDGERWVVPTGPAGSAARPGELLLARVCGAGDAHRFVGAILTIPLRLRDSLLDLIAAEPEAWDWLDWLAAATAPPTLANTEGEPLMFCEADYRIDHEAAARALGEGFDEAEGDGPGRVFHQMLDRDGARWVRGTLRLDGDRLRIEANSEARFEGLQERIAALVPDAQPLGIRRTGFQEAIARASAGAASAPGPKPPPGTEELIAEYLADQDRRWLDLEIPALGGRTPREAAGDPTRREDLLLLLGELERSFGSPERAARIRAALDLPSA